MSATYTYVQLFRLPDGQIRAQFETNDDNDDGYPDGDVTSYELMYRDLDAVPSYLRYSHRGAYGQPVRVWLDGTEQLTEPVK